MPLIEHPPTTVQPLPPLAKAERALLLAPTGRDAPLLAGALNGAGVGTHICEDMTSICRELSDGAGVAILAEEALGRGELGLLLQALADQPAWSELPLIILTAPGVTTRGSTQLAERLEPIANVTHVERPCRPLTLASMVRSALRARRRQYEVRRLLEEQERSIVDARETIRQRDQFLAMLGHELRNPLAAITTCIGLLDRLKWTPEAVTKYRDIFNRQTKHLGRLVDDLLDVTRITRGIVNLEMKSVDLLELIQRVANAMQPRFAEAGVELRCMVPDRPIHVDGDAVRLEQVFTNLLTNAAKFTPRDGHVAIHLHRDADGNARVDVIDDGIGIPAEMLTRVFDVFAQAHVAIDRTLGGLGIGLTVVKHLVEMHGGTVVAQSEGLCHGSTFTLRLPCTHQEKTVMETPAPSTRIRQRVLIVEDNPDVRMMISALLDMQGYDVETAEDGPSGLEKAIALQPDVIVLDIGLPGLDGYEVARAVRAKGLTHTKLIAMTGYGQEEDRKRAFDSGFDIHLVKPVDPDRLSAAINGRVAA